MEKTGPLTRPEKKASICLLVVFLAGSLALSACRKQEAGARRKGPLAVRVAPVRVGPVRERVEYVGTLHSTREIKVLARVAGRIVALPAREGDSVRRGKTIAVIAAPEISARVSRIYAELARAKEESAFLCKLAGIDRRLLRAKAISRIKVEQSQQRCSTSKAAVRAAQASLRESRAVRGKALERAPFDGMVLKWLAQPGENVMPGRPILLFGGRDMEVRALVQERDIAAGIGLGRAVDVTLASEKTFRASVSAMAPMAAGAGRMFDVRIALPSSRVGDLRHGVSVNLAFVLHERIQATAVSLNAITERNGEKGVFAVRDNRAHWVGVKVLFGETGWVAVESNLTPKDKVVVSNLEEVRDGMALYPVQERGGMP